MRIGFNCYTTPRRVLPATPLERGTLSRCKTGGVWFGALVALFIAMPAYAETTPADRKTVSSKAYVDTSVETRQEKIPATNPNNTNIGVSVVMYTEDGDGEIGERQIYDGTNNYTSGDANKLVTASALKGSVTNLPTMETSKLTCANESAGCTLWTIVDQEVYGDEDNNGNGGN